MTFKHALSSGLLASVATLAACEFPTRNPSDLTHQVVRVIVVPESLSLAPAQQFRFAAYGRTASGDSTGVAVSWTASGGSVAPDGMFTADTAVGDFQVSATSAPLKLSAASLVRIRRRPVASVTVTPASVSLQGGQTAQLAAMPRDSAGNALPRRAVTWASDNPNVASVDGTGLVTANAGGSATITATSEGQSGSAAVTVAVTTVPVATVSVTPASLSLTVGQTGQLTATPQDVTGAPLTGRVVTWVSSNTLVATVNGSGLVTAKAAGSATITATSEGRSGSAAVTVTNAPVATVSVTPASLSLTVGQTGQLTATPQDASGAPLTGRVVTWVSSNTLVATVNGSGLVTAKAAGSATITATSEGRSGGAAVTGTNVPVATVSVTPASLSLTVGQTGQLTATPQDASGAPLTGRVVTWASSNTAVAMVNGSGLVTANAAGSATITATSEGQGGSATVTAMGATAATGLDFPGNVSVPTVRFEFTSPFAAYPATYIWRVYPRQQAGYYTSFFHANNSSNFNNQYQYYGFHPYPYPTYPPPPGTTAVQEWEISVDGGADITGDPVVFNRWYLQVAVVYKDGSGTHHTYYWDWPDTTHQIHWDGSLYAAAPNPAIMVGDNPWNPGEEVYDGVMRGFQFYDAALTPSQIAQEIAAPGSVRQPWYLNLNPTPGDISDKSGSGHHPSWVGTARPALWTGSGP